MTGPYTNSGVNNWFSTSGRERRGGRPHTKKRHHSMPEVRCGSLGRRVLRPSVSDGCRRCSNIVELRFDVITTGVLRRRRPATSLLYCSAEERSEPSWDWAAGCSTMPHCRRQRVYCCYTITMRQRLLCWRNCEVQSASFQHASLDWRLRPHAPTPVGYDANYNSMRRNLPLNRTAAVWADSTACDEKFKVEPLLCERWTRRRRRRAQA